MTQAGGALETLTTRLGYRAVDALAYHVARLCRIDGDGNGVFDAARALATVVAAQSPSAMATSLDPLQKWLRRLMHALLELVDVGSVHGQEQVRFALSVPTSPWCMLPVCFAAGLPLVRRRARRRFPNAVGLTARCTYTM